MDDELGYLFVLAGDQPDRGAVERWFTAVDRAYAGAASWREFDDRFRAAARGFDGTVVDTFLSDAGDGLSDPLDVVRRFHVEIGPGRAFDAWRAVVDR